MRKRIAQTTILTLVVAYLVTYIFAGGPDRVRNGKVMKWSGPINFEIDRGPLGDLTGSQKPPAMHWCSSWFLLATPP